jgi:hypothetical protein
MEPMACDNPETRQALIDLDRNYERLYEKFRMLGPPKGPDR